jgi:hypothetical protein
MTKYTLNKGQQGEKVLMINGIQSFCPFVDPIPMQGNMGQIQLMRLPCTSACPHAVVNEEEYCITCSGKLTIFELEEEESPKSDVLTIVE